MKIYHKTGKTKRGNIYAIRGDKKSTGYSKVKADCKKQYLMYKNYPITKLCVLGTLDHLAKMFNPYIRQMQKEHLINKGYYKTVYCLTDAGKKRLKTYKILKKMGIPLWEYMYQK